MITLFGGGGFLGSAFRKYSKFKWAFVPKAGRKPISEESLYMISTTDNYNVLEDPLLDIRTNLVVLMDVLKNHEPQFTFNFVSSWFVYGTNEGACHEETPCRPRGFYSITKLCAEQLVESYCKTFGINYRIFRLANLYALGDRKASLKKNALCFLINELKSGRGIDLYWGGDSRRNFIHVIDAVKAIDICLEKAPLNTVINIGSEKSESFGTLIYMAKDYLNSMAPIGYKEPTKFHEIVQTRHFDMDTSKLQALGFKTQVSLAEGIKELCHS